MKVRKRWRRLAAGAMTACLAASVLFCGRAEQVRATVEITLLPEGGEFPGEDSSERAALREDEQTIRSTRGLIPSVPYMDPGENLSNVINLDQFNYESLSQEAKQALQTNQFYVSHSDRSGGGGYAEFYELYESNRYWNKPNFVTVDSLMHTYHLTFSALMRQVEREMLSPRLISLSRELLESSRNQLEALKGTEWENAARRNVAFFTIGLKLQAPETEAAPEVAEVVGRELEKIQAAAEISPCLLFEGSDSFYSGTHDEDYSQYRPRGNYEGDPVLEAYFRAMMWYGRMTFLAEDEDATRSALLITEAIREGGAEDWEAIYAVSSFFAGTSDDCIYYDYRGAVSEAWPSGAAVSALPGDTASFAAFREAVKKLDPPKINSLASHKGAEQDESGKGFRLMGQRYNLDGEIYERLTEWNPDESLSRVIPDALDVPNALGSPAAEKIMNETEDARKPIYRDNLPLLREEIRQADEAVWTSSLYAGWLHTLTPLLSPRPAGYPAFATTEAWLYKTLETYEGSYTELKHDTVLYAKQVFVAEGDGENPAERDDRGYVEPEPEVYARFASLAADTKNGLEEFGMLDSEKRTLLEDLAVLAFDLLTISEKELQNQPLTEYEYESIRHYGAAIERFWEFYAQEMYGDGLGGGTELDASLVTDIASGDGWVLELGTGLAQEILVVVPVEGKLRLASGTVYSFYEFLNLGGQRLTDSEWKEMNGFRPGPGGADPTPVEKPDWTMGYRVNPWSW